MIKKVEGNEFQVAKRTIAATSFQPEDEPISVQVITDNQQVVLQTKRGLFPPLPGTGSVREEERSHRRQRDQTAEE